MSAGKDQKSQDHISDVPLPDYGVKQVCYAACFIDAMIDGVTVENGRFKVRYFGDLDLAKVERDLLRLCDRFGQVADDDETALFAVPAPMGHVFGQGDDFLELLVPVAPGLRYLRGMAVDIFRFLDWVVLRDFAAAFGAEEEIYPNVIPMDVLAKTGHFSSFPEHVHFVSHLSEDLDVLENFANRARIDGEAIKPTQAEMASPDLVHNPATCYHCYAAREGQNLAQNTVITAVTQCHRYESANHAELGRQLEFTLREIIFLGSPDFVREKREAVLEKVKDWVESWQLIGRLIPANDPFFASDFTPKAQQQRRMLMKYEYKAALGDGAELAVLSSNLHGPTFGKAFGIKQDGRLISTGCLGFGLERLAIAILMQHGAGPKCWPDTLRSDFEDWQKSSPLDMGRSEK